MMTVTARQLSQAMAKAITRLNTLRTQVTSGFTARSLSSSATFDKINEVVNLTITSKSPFLDEKSAFVIIQDYQLLNEEEKQKFLLNMALNHRRAQSDINHQINAVMNSDTLNPLKAQQRLRDLSTQPYEKVFKLLAAVDGGVKFLVDLRRDINESSKGVENTENLTALMAMSNSLKQMLSMWFGVGFLSLERITWKSSCDMLEKIASYEAVHPVRNVSDLRLRVGPYRRCFVFTHPSMPREPLVILHVALVKDISSSIQSIVRHPSLSSSDSFLPYNTNQEDVRLFDTAIFYSITSTQAGLQSIDLGNYLIKRVVKELSTEFPSLSKFCTLSPIPGFRDWLITEINQCLNGTKPNLLTVQQNEDLAKHFQCPKEDKAVLAKLKSSIQDGQWAKNEATAERLKGTLLPLCIRYLYVEKRKSFALNSVANFHLRNGATLWRVNWLANITARGLNESCGIMVNYRYYIDKTESNSFDYINKQIIDIDEQVLNLLKV